MLSRTKRGSLFSTNTTFNLPTATPKGHLFCASAMVRLVATTQLLEISLSRRPCTISGSSSTAFQLPLPRQPAESYGSYGSYGHTVIRRRLGTSGTLPGIEASSRPNRATRGRNSDFALPPRSEFQLRYFVQKNPSPGQRRRSGSDMVLARSLPESPCRQSCCQRRTQSCVGHRIAPLGTGLLHSILCWAQDCPTQSCVGHRIAPLNPVLDTGLPRCLPENSGCDAVNVASLPDSAPGFPSSNLASKAKGRMGKIKLFPTRVACDPESGFVQVRRPRRTHLHTYLEQVERPVTKTQSL